MFTPTIYIPDCNLEAELISLDELKLHHLKNVLRIKNEDNEMVIEEEKIENNKLRTKFADSMKMSSYLVAFVIGDLEATSVGKSKTTDIRIIHRPGFSHQTLQLLG